MSVEPHEGRSVFLLAVQLPITLILSKDEEPCPFCVAEMGAHAEFFACQYQGVSHAKWPRYKYPPPETGINIF